MVLGDLENRGDTEEPNLYRRRSVSVSDPKHRFVVMQRTAHLFSYSEYGRMTKSVAYKYPKCLQKYEIFGVPYIRTYARIHTSGMGRAGPEGFPVVSIHPESSYCYDCMPFQKDVQLSQFSLRIPLKKKKEKRKCS